MDRDQLDQIPDFILERRNDGGQRLTAWLDNRGWQMSLLELHDERQRRGLDHRERTKR